MDAVFHPRCITDPKVCLWQGGGAATLGKRYVHFVLYGGEAASGNPPGPLPGTHKRRGPRVSACSLPADGKAPSHKFLSRNRCLPFIRPTCAIVCASQVFEQEGWHHELNDAEEEMTYKVGEGGFRGHGRMIG